MVEPLWKMSFGLCLEFLPWRIFLRQNLWLCGARECSMISTIVKPLSAQSLLLCKPARMHVAFSATTGILSALAPLQVKETVFLLSEYRQASEQQELAHKCTGPIVDCLEPENVDQEWEFPFLCGLGTGVLVALALASILCSHRVQPATLRVWRVRPNHSEDARTERSHVVQSGSRIVASYPCELDRFVERILG